jgi:hypothetical protein
MTGEIQLANRSLYDQDFNLWLSATGQHHQSTLPIAIRSQLREVRSKTVFTARAVVTLSSQSLIPQYYIKEKGYRIQEALAK